MKERVAPILETNGKLRSNAFLILQGHMLFPDDPITAEHYEEDIERDIARVGRYIERDEVLSNSFKEGGDPPMSLLGQHLVATSHKRSKKGWDVGQVALRLVQLSDHWEAPSLNKAMYLTSIQWAKESGHGKRYGDIQAAKQGRAKDADEHFRERLRPLWRQFWPVVHFWAARCFVDDKEYSKAAIGGAEFVGFLRIASFFERRLSLIAEKAPSQWKLRASDLLSVPSQFPEPAPELKSDPLRPQDIKDLRSYNAADL